jgi:hypothetical protein
MIGIRARRRDYGKAEHNNCAVPGGDYALAGAKDKAQG